MILKRWRCHLAYSLMSAFLVWHTLAMLVAPLPGSYLSVAARNVFAPYLDALWIHNPWDFYAPIIAHGERLRYVIQDSEGKTHSFTPIDEINRLHPNYKRVNEWHYWIRRSPEYLAPSYIAAICKYHQSLHPISVRLITRRQVNFYPEEFLNGHTPLEDAYISELNLGDGKCPAQ